MNTNKMSVILKHGTLVYELQIDNKSTIGDIKGKLSKIANIPEHIIKLEYNGKTLDINPSYILSKIGIQNGSVIFYNCRIFTEERDKELKDNGF